MERSCSKIKEFFIFSQKKTFLILGQMETPPKKSVRPYLVAYTSLCSTCVTFGLPFHTISHEVLLTQPFLGRLRTSPGVTSILRMCLCPHILSLFASSCLRAYLQPVNNFGLILCVSNYQFKAVKKYHSSQSATNFSHNCFLKNTFQKIF